jgi:hypothetical protein
VLARLVTVEPEHGDTHAVKPGPPAGVPVVDVSAKGHGDTETAAGKTLSTS